MRRLGSIPGALLILAACGGGAATDTLEPVDLAAQAPPATAAPVTTTTRVVVTTHATTTTASQSLGLLTTGAIAEAQSLVAEASDVVDVYANPGDTEPIRTLDATTILGTPTVLAVVEGPQRGWARVLIPGRPNGAQGWVQSEMMSLYVVDGEVEVDLSDRTLRYLENGVEVISTTVGIGSTHNPTPTGSFFVTDSVTLADPDSPWGPHALGLSARSDTITEYNGGDGIIGIHGTDQPLSIGNAASLGCVRVPNEIITRLHQVVEIGTPVDINA